MRLQKLVEVCTQALVFADDKLPILAQRPQRLPLHIGQFGVRRNGPEHDALADGVPSVEFLFELVFERNDYDRFAEDGRFRHTLESARGNQAAASNQFGDVAGEIWPVHFKIGRDRGGLVGAKTFNRLAGLALTVTDEFGQVRAIIQITQERIAGLRGGGEHILPQ